MKTLEKYDVIPGRVLVAGDWHGNNIWASGVVADAARLLDDQEHKIILQLGDFGVWYGKHGDLYLNDLSDACQDAGVEVFFIDGNHEAFPRLHKYAEKSAEENFIPVVPHVTWIRRGSRWKWHGRRWLALGGATSLDRERRTENVSWWPEEEITDEDVHYAVSGGRADVMITHDCPAAVVHTYPEYGFPAKEQARADLHSRKLQGVVNAVKPAYLMHGHLHMCYQRNVFMPYGECEVTGLGMDGDETNWFILDTRTMEFETH